MKKLLFILCTTIVLVQCQRKDPQDTVATAVPPDFIKELWYKNSLIYNLDVKVFKDSDGNGFGDFKGLIQQLDYLKKLGVDVIWLSPFQPTPDGDDGYDIADFYGIDSRIGTRADFEEFMKQAKARNIRVIMDLVINHTSDQHPWFQQARRDEKSPYRSWYVWSEERPKNWDKGMVFPGVQKETWSYDKQAKAYYFHRFYNFQPDLNAQNPAVQLEVRKIIGYWLATGMSGFRLDAVPFFIEKVGDDPNDPEHQFELITQMHQFVQWRKGDAMVLGEANVDPKEQKPYFGEQGTGMQMMFNFYANQHLFYALATGELKPFTKALEETKGIPPTAQWAYFLRNHDEIDLGRLTESQRNKVYDKFGPDKSMQLYDRGIRRRLASMLGDRQQIELAYSLLLSMPGAPAIRYGEELGMGDDLRLKERLSVRTPMQWSTDRNAGFSTASKTVRPVISQGPYSYQRVNVVTESQDSTSLLNWLTTMIQLRKQHPEIGWGDWNLLDTGSPSVLAMQYEWQNRSVLMVHNFSKNAQQVQLQLKKKPVRSLTSLLDKSRQQASSNGQYVIALGKYGYNWYEVK
ncbi:alpha-amylase family protein [Spirosoma soli]|uniref:Alpha-amylase family protein n=1 Tax=Spirosoma soli TaxID=1770529 RepID=A0ABW5M6J4_9BACT